MAKTTRVYFQRGKSTPLFPDVPHYTLGKTETLMSPAIAKKLWADLGLDPPPKPKRKRRAKRKPPHKADAR